MDAVTAFFDADEWPYAAVDATGLQLAFQGSSGSWACLVRVRELEQRVLFYSYLPARVPVDRRHAMAEFVLRANYGLMLGNFELDLDDGEVRFKTSIDVDGAELSPVLMKHVAYANVFTFDRYFQAAMAVALAGMAPLDGIRLSEGEPAPVEEA